ncbi:hypothetical protein [Campylobacter sp. 2457A]|uniref:hypothetical protein n=1 Tax=Campylobacter sp. 2457A TaxID=2735784 RepID=UPI00301CB00B|nr:hypothetical protein [Campylobacter sp. 2457A]
MSSNTEIKEQDTQDEIIFEEKKYIPSFLYYGIVYTGFLCFFLYLSPRLFDKEINYKWFIGFIVYLYFLYMCISLIYKAANFKKIYITKEKLVIEFYLRNDLIFPLGAFFVYSYEPSRALLGDIVIQTFKGKRYHIKNLIKHEIEPKNNFFARVNVIIKPYVMPYLLSLSDEEFEKTISFVTGFYDIKTTFLKEAIELRKEKKDVY